MIGPVPPVDRDRALQIGARLDRLPATRYVWTLLLMLSLYNFARWYGRRSRVEDKSKQFLREARVRQSQKRERSEPDPTFDFTDRPAPPGGLRPPIDQPPSNN